LESNITVVRLALYGCEWLVSRSGPLPTGTHSTENWVRPQ